MKKYIFIFFLVFSFACELIVDVDIPFERAQLTVNSFFSPDSLWVADVSLNRHILNDTLFQKVDDGLVIIYCDGLPIDTLIHLEKGLYKSDTGKPLIGPGYEISVSAPEYETLRGRSQIPSPALLSRVELIQGDYLPGGNLTDYLKITFTDDGSTKNYYHLTVETESEQYDFRTGRVRVSRNRIPMESEDPALQNDNFNRDGFVLKDVLFNGKEITLSFKMPYSNLSFAAAVIVSLHTTSEDYYQYMTTVQLQQETSGDPFAQPVNVHNNITGGFGIFAGYSTSVFVYGGNPKPVITTISPLKGKPGDHIIISGENFTGPTNNFPSVSFTGRDYLERAQITRQSDSELEVIVPDRAISGKIIIHTGGRIAVSETDFEVTN